MKPLLPFGAALVAAAVLALPAPAHARHSRRTPPPPPPAKPLATPTTVSDASRVIIAAGSDGADAFAVPDGLEDAVNFWQNVYAKYTTRQVVMHDNRYLGITYGVLDFSSLVDGKRTDPEIDKLIDDGVEVERKRLVNVLKDLASYKGDIPLDKLSPETRKIYKAFEPVDELDKFTAAAERVRGQRGQRDKFLHGIGDVGPYMPKMEQIFRARGLPSDLSRLTFVESMFNLHAYSRVGAAGPWQFMSGTGRLFLTITPEVDERMDPLKAADAAARLLAFNYRELGNWGLALTAYNHGVGGMRRAVKEVGSDDVGQIVWAYDSRSFGFASRNFFAEFLAARSVYNNRAKFFGADLAKLPQKPPVAWDEVVLPEHVPLATFESYTGLTDEQLRELNPALTSYVYSGAKYLPKNYPLKVPVGQASTVAVAYAKIPRELRFAEQKPNEFHQVKRGETMVAIAKRYGMSVDALMNLNSLGTGSRLRAGQKLRVLPGKPVPAAVAVASIAGEKNPKVKVLPPVKLPEDTEPLPTAAEPMSEEEAAVLATAEAPAEDPGAPSKPATGSGVLAAVPLPSPTPTGPTLLSMLSAPFGIVSPEASIAGANAAAAPPATPAAHTPYIPDSALSLALLEPGEPGMAAPPEFSAPAEAPSASHEPSPLAALHDPALSRERGSRPYPGGLHCRLVAEE